MAHNRIVRIPFKPEIHVPRAINQAPRPLLLTLSSPPPSPLPARGREKRVVTRERERGENRVASNVDRGCDLAQALGAARDLLWGVREGSFWALGTLAMGGRTRPPPVALGKRAQYSAPVFHPLCIVAWVRQRQGESVRAFGAGGATPNRAEFHAGEHARAELPPPRGRLASADNPW
jgi:hypothetical protein